MAELCYGVMRYSLRVGGWALPVLAVVPRSTQPGFVVSWSGPGRLVAGLSAAVYFVIRAQESGAP